MNAQLLNPFSIDLPDSVSATLETAECSTLRFNHGLSLLAGHYLAVGRLDGYITIWDIESKSVLRLLAGHVRTVKALAWSSYNRYLASCSADWCVIVWDLAAKSVAGDVLRAHPAHPGSATNGAASDGVEGATAEPDPRLPCASERKATIRFDCAVTSVQFAPGNSKKLLIVLASLQAFLVDITEKIVVRRRRGTDAAEELPELEGVPTSPTRIPLLCPIPSAIDKHSMTIYASITAARFTPDSRFIIAGTSRGSLLIFDPCSGELMDEKDVLGTGSAVKELSFDPAGRYLVVNCNDRVIRVISISTIQPSSSPVATAAYNNAVDLHTRSTKRRKTSLEMTLLHKIQDVIQRTPWSSVGFSPESSDYIFAGAAHKAAHNIHIYDRVSGTLSKILEGPKDWLVSADWHPCKPMLASASNTGSVYVWWSVAEENWSAYAPGFEELEENIEYEEREGEFDFEDGRHGKDKRRQEEEEAALVRLVQETAEVRTRIAHRNQTAPIDLNDVYKRLHLPPHIQQGQWGQAFQDIAQDLASLDADSGWNTTKSSQAREIQIRELVFTRLDDDNSYAFIIPPRLETDYSDFHDDRL